MGERAQKGYEEAEREAFRRLPNGDRLWANAVAAVVTASLAAVVVLWVVGSS